MSQVLDKDGAHVSDGFFKAAGRDTDKGPFTRWIARRLTYRDASTAGTSNPVLAFTLPAHTVIHDAAFECGVDFAGGTVNALTVALGISGGDVDAFLEEVSMFTGAANATLIGFNAPETALGVELMDATHKRQAYYVGTSALEVDVNFVSTAGNLNVLTAGEVIVYLLVSNPREAFVVG